MTLAILFVFGAAIGSFLNVVALRYRPDKFLFSRKIIGGRSRCPKCRRTLRWFELVPLVSFIIQNGHCRRCGSLLGWQYPAVEILSGLIFVLVPVHLSFYWALSVLWILVFLALLLMSLVDLRLSIIPDEINIFLMALGVAFLIFNPRVDFLLNHLISVALAGGIFWFLIFITRGRGMGWGDFKLSIPLGLIFGLPDIVLLIAASFIVGAIFGVGAIALGRKKMKSRIPFGPFLGAAAALTFFFGAQIIPIYASLFYL